MARFLSILLWTVVFLLIVLAVDQLLVRMPASHPAHVAVAGFYRDLRGRVCDLARGEKPAPAPTAAPLPARREGKGKDAPPASIEGVIGAQQGQAAKVPKPVANPPAGKGATPRYVYADAGGELHFADTLAEVPEEYRGTVRTLGE